MSDAISWLPGVDSFDANPAATVSLDRARWQALGATFVEVDDGDDEAPALAVGQVHGLSFAVLDYGDASTFVLVPGRGEAAVDSVRAVLDALEEVGGVRDDQILDVVSSERLPSRALEERVVLLERQMEVVLSGTTDASDVSEAPAPTTELTNRELDVARLAARGYSNGRIARELWVNEQTVKLHLSNIYRKLAVANRTELMALIPKFPESGEARARSG